MVYIVTTVIRLTTEETWHCEHMYRHTPHSSSNRAPLLIQ
jgi:hypothetical protein